MADGIGKLFGPTMTVDAPDVTSVAARLWAAREAYHRFLGLAAVDCLIDGEKLAALSRDVAGAGRDAHAELDAPGGRDPFDHDWSALYRGSILDD